jgi:hypothetical protein
MCTLLCIGPVAASVRSTHAPLKTTKVTTLTQLDWLLLRLQANNAIQANIGNGNNANVANQVGWPQSLGYRCMLLLAER